MAFTLNGTGTTYYGERWQPDGGYITTKWIVFFYIPLIPLGSVKVVASTGTYGGVGLSGNSMKVVPAPLDVAAVCRMYIYMGAAFTFLFFGVPQLNWLVDRLMR